MGGVIDKPGLRESIDLLQALAAIDPADLTTNMLDEHLCYLGKRKTDLANIRKGLARLEQAIRSPHSEIDEWVSWAVSEPSTVLESE